MNHRYFRTGDPAWPRKSKRRVRAGVMINGRVCMAPSRLDMTSGKPFEGEWMSRVKVYRDGLYEPHAIAYDEGLGEVLVSVITLDGQPVPPQLLHGHIQAVPRPAL